MTDKERKSCICTIKMLRNLAFNVHEVMDVIDYENCEKMISLLESFRQTGQQWIPTSERLPKDDTEVIVSCTDDSGDNELSYVTTGWHYKGLWVVNNDRCYFVKAWKPLPERPWKEEQNG